MTIIEQLKYSNQLQENQEIEFKSAKGGFPDVTVNVTVNGDVSL